jgi:hypothetical protein
VSSAPVRPPTTQPDQAEDGPLVEPPFPAVLVEELLRALTKAARAQQLYLPNNPIYRGALDAVRAAFTAVWAHTDELSLVVAETELRWSDIAVLSEGPKGSDNLAWLFFKDGVRELTLSKGIEETEILKLLEIIQRGRKASADEDDLVTMLWEADLSLLKYRYVDLVADGGGGGSTDLSDGSEGGVPAEPGQVRSAMEGAVEESRAAGVVNMADFDGTLYFLDEKEIEYLQDEIAREYRQDLRTNIVAALLDIFEQQTDAAVRSEVLDHLDTMLVYLLTAGHFRGVGFLLQESQTSGNRTAALPSEFRDRLARFPDRLSAREPLTQLLQALDDAPVQSLPSREELSSLFDQLRPSALGTVFHWLPRIRNDTLKGMLEIVGGRLAAMNTAELVRLIQVPEKDVSAEAIRRAGALKAQAAVLALGKIVGEPDTARRQLAAQALAEIGSPGALQALERAVEDTDRDVRITAVRALTARAYRPVLSRLEAIVRGKAIRDADLTEKMAYFEAYGTLCGDTGVPHLDTILNGKGFLGRREDSEVRACAAVALGRIATPKALESLQRAGTEKDIVVRNAVTRALRGSPT